MSSNVSEGHLHVVGQVVLVKRVRLKAVRRCVKVVTPDATYEAFCLEKKSLMRITTVYLFRES